MAAEPEAAEIAQISFYLSKSGQSFSDVIDADAGLEGKTSFQVHNFKASEVDCQFIYFETNTPKSSPPWLEFMNEQIAEAKRISFSARSRSPNGLLLVGIDKRILIATFGRSASSVILRSSLELDFGIKTAMNLCGNEEVRQTRTQTTTLMPTHIDRQASRPSEAFAFGLSEAEDLKYISAHMKGNSNVTLQGRDSLTYKIIGDQKLTWEQLIDECHSFLKAYSSKNFVALFPNYRNFNPADDAEIAKLDDALINALKSRKFQEVQLAIPEVLIDDEYSFSYSNYRARENTLYSYLDISQLAASIDLENVTIKKLKAKQIYAYSHIEDRILPHKRWGMYSCILFEKKLGKNYFILNDGRWMSVASDFYDSITTFIKTKLRVEPSEATYSGISIADSVALKNREAVFNEEVCKRNKRSVLFDRAKLRIGNGRKDKEFCDILDMTSDGIVRIINCKPLKGASSINYLFSQAKFYCEAFLQDENFLADIRDHIAKSGSSAKAEYLKYIRPEIEQIKGQDFRVCLWLLCPEKESLPSAQHLPLIAQYELKMMHDHLRRVCKFEDVILRFIPVKSVNYTKTI